MAEVTAEEAGRSLAIIAKKMLDVGVLSQEGFSVLSTEAQRLRRFRNATSWSVAIERDRPVTFARVKDKAGEQMVISLSAKGISIVQADDDQPPFTELDVAIAIEDLAGQPVCRWHLDRANPDQPGPLFHLQFGGHQPGQRVSDFTLKEPRWCHPPMEVALLCEVILANFFEKIWSESLRDDLAWCRAIQVFQRLCYSAYSKRFLESANVSHSTSLAQMWNGAWA